jgi:LacI family transcriptional regulator
LRGIIRAYEELGRPKEEIDIIPMNRWPSGYNGGYLIAKELFSRRNVDGIFAYSDVVAIGVSRAVAKAGLGIPADVKLIGFDNIEAAEYLPVSLSTVAQPEFEPVKAALELAMERTGDFERPPREVVFPSSLIARESCPLNDNSLREKIFSPVSKNK